jgi:hypothetical protein
VRVAIMTSIPFGGAGAALLVPTTAPGATAGPWLSPILYNWKTTMRRAAGTETS